ncbi:MAG: hypothetical protein JSV33_13685 [bacterium]|nr:MAG: hypothetical protein JSV33_13685 [bacterium]
MKGRWYYAGIVSLILLAVICTSAAVAGADEGADSTFVPVYHPSVAISRSAGPIEVDGHTEDAGWRGAAKIGNFA